jgi:hypothetical protein
MSFRGQYMNIAHKRTIADNQYMPDKPTWSGSIDNAIKNLASLPCSEVDSGMLAELLGLKRRRAQQILAPLVGRTVGRSSLIPKDAVIRHLRSRVSGDTEEAEKQRRARLRAKLAGAMQPKVLVEAPPAIVRQQLENLPAGVSLAPGRIVLEGFTTVEEAQQKILALIMALGNNPEGFAELVTVDEG